MSGLTGTDIARRVKRLFGDESGVQVTDEDIIDWVNDAIREAFFQNDELDRLTLYPEVLAKDNRVNLAPMGGTVPLTIESVHYRETATGAFYQIPYMSSRAFNEYIPDWDTTNLATPLSRNLPLGIPIAWTRGDGQSEIVLYPVPETGGTGLLKVVVGAGGGFITLLTDELVNYIPEHLHNYIVEFCMMKAYELDEDWEAVRTKGEIVQSSLDFNQGRNSWVGRDSYPIIVPSPDDM